VGGTTNVAAIAAFAQPHHLAKSRRPRQQRNCIDHQSFTTEPAKNEKYFSFHNTHGGNDVQEFNRGFRFFFAAGLMMFVSGSLFAQEWSAPQKGVWKSVEA